MSRSGMHNFQGRNIGDSVVRSLALGRDLERFLDEMGRAPFTPEEAYEAVNDGRLQLWTRRRGRRWGLEAEMLPVGLDCLEAVKRATQEIENQVDDSWSRYDDFADSGYGEDFGPMNNVFWAFMEIEWDVSRQEAAAWDLHDCGFVADDDMPVFMRRATPYEAVVDMERRILQAEREREIRDLTRITAALG